ncbi:threonine--tRNA ligase [Candidatus Nomurabacteria bacterium RIFCSPLOWO2_01_FULL_46_18]|uniref:Threonine--tRNA ligase n=1 Tax=Candidatus Nomurabacteria bacterium RIFCSPLOWO2_01_FULL_46_18 TaxID=1801783 RepID=A0A1F6XDY3_9BACT|nr:MAG: threonine--tRNA ligase [Candidatus Nomurabacteria bacterium RIFCSPLOWO2_01_FULL_46_18]
MKKEADLANLRHSLAHLLAAAVLELYPGTKNTIGPAIEDGFYYDFEFGSPISDKDLPKIEKKMKEILKKWDKFSHEEKNEKEARNFFKDNAYKLELIDEIKEKKENITFYACGEFVDLCRGGHVESPSKEINPDAFKLDRIAGAYWRGDEKNKMLTRIYGLAFETKAELEAYTKQREEAEKRDHKKLGKELDLFTFSDLVGAGLPLWTPKGTLMRHLLDDYVWNLRKAYGYERVEIPHITKKQLYETSGHWDKFQDQLFHIKTREGHEFVLKPMNCPHHTQIFARRPHSYRDMPQRYANTTMQYRDEQSGELSGLSRVRSISIDDAHVFCRNDQIEREIGNIWNIVDEFYGVFGFGLEVRLSLRDPKTPEKYLGLPEYWEKAEKILRDIAKKRKVKTIEGIGEAAFYGPKIDFIAKDSLGREWQVATIQLDFNQPKRFGLYFTTEKGTQELVIMIHAAIMGSLERFMSILIEHYAGAFPLWLSPVQVRVLPIGEAHLEYSREIFEALKNENIRVELDESNETLGKKIRNGKTEKIPYLVVLGDKEKESKTLTAEGRTEKLENISLEKFMARLKEEIKNKK